MIHRSGIRRILLSRSALPVLAAASALGCCIPVAGAQAQNIAYYGPGDYTLTRTDPVVGGPRTIDVTVTSGDANLNLASVATANPNGTFAYPGTAIAVANQGPGAITIASKAITATGSNPTYAIDATSGAGAITITSGTIQATQGSIFSSSRAISALSGSGAVNIASDTIATDGPTGIYAQGRSVAVTSNSISIGGDADYSFGSTGAIFAQDSGGGVAVKSTSITANGTDLSGILINGTGVSSVASGSITASGLYARGISSYGTGDVSINSGSITVSGYGATGISVGAYGGNAISIVSDTITTAGFATGISASAGSGALSISSNTITTADDFGYGMQISGGSGSLAIKSGTVSTNGQYATGINVAGYGFATGATTITSSRVTTSGPDADGISVVTSGPITINSGTVITTGYGSASIRTYTNAGDINIVAGTTSTAGGTDPYSTAPAIEAIGSNAVRIVADNSVATGDRAIAIRAIGDTVSIDANTVSVPGASGTAISAQGRVVTVSAQVVTSSANGIVADGREATSVVAGTVVAGKQPAITASSGGSADVTVTGSVTSVTGPAVMVTAGNVASFSLGAAGRLDDSGQVTLTGGTGETVNNAGSISGSATIPIVTATGGALTFNNIGRFTGLIGFTGRDDVVNNSGTFNANSNSDFGAGNDVFNNSGTFRVLGIATTAGTVTMTGLETFKNTGLVDLRNGHAGDVLVLPGTYTGGGAAQLGLDVNVNVGAATNAADQLHVVGAATGTTVVSLNLLNAAPAVLSTAAGITLVQAGAGSTANAFTINGANVDHGLIQYGIVYNPTAFSYNLVAAPTAAAYRTALFAQSARNLWLQSGDAWTAHMRELRDNLAANGPGSAGGRVWGQAIGQVEQRTDSVNYAYNGIATAANMGYKQDYFGGQLGVDFGAPAGTGAFAFGVTGGYLSSDLTFATSADRITFDTVNGGVYANYASGMFFVNALGKYDYYWANNVGVSGGYNLRTKGAVYGGKGEVGFRVGSTLWIEPSASASYTHSDFHDFGVASGTFSFNDQDGIRGKGGARVGYTADVGSAKLTVYGGGNYVHEFQGRDQVAFTSGGQVAVFGAPKLRDYGEGTLGVNIGSQHGMVSGFFEGRYADGGDYEGYGGRAGMRVRF